MFTPWFVGVKKKTNVEVKQTEEMFSRVVKQMTECKNVTEQLKADDQMEWVARMNNFRSRATEIVNNDIIYI